jgi:hypothetical protein
MLACGYIDIEKCAPKGALDTLAFRAGQIVLGTASLLAVQFLTPAPALAQGTDNQSLYFDGSVPDSEERLKDVPVTPAYRDFLPQRVDLASLFPRPGNQGQQGSCTGWAVGYARAFYARAVEGRNVSRRENIPSPAYIYNATKPPGPCNGKGFGASIADALDLLKTGSLSLQEYPYSDRSCSPPDSAARSHAVDFRIDSWAKVSPQEADQIKGELYHKNPVILNLHDSRTFQHLRPGQIYRTPGEYLGWHAITVVGYDESRQAFKFINSWSTDWGDQGFGWIDYETLRTEVIQAFVMRAGAPPTPPEPEPTPVVVIPPSPEPRPTPIALPSVNCGQVRVNERAGKREIVGYVGSDDDLERLRTALPGSDVNVVVRPWPQCEALETLEKPLTRSDADRPKVQIRKPTGETLASGEELAFEIETPSYTSYLHVAYIQADGSVLNLVQPGVGSLRAYSPHSKLVLGSEPGSTRRFRVSAPFGREMLIVLAGRSPIFPDLRPGQETEREFLTALRRALIAKPDPTAPDRDVTAAYDAIVTVEGRSP